MPTVIHVCLGCLPKGLAHRGPPLNFDDWIWGPSTRAYDCATCNRKGLAAKDVVEVDGTAADVRFAKWKDTYENGGAR